MERFDDKENIELQAKKHELVKTKIFLHYDEYLLYLIHIKPYEDISGISAGKKILDLGCNNGYGTNVMRGGCDSIIGADVSAKAIKAAKAKYSGNNIDFVEIDGYSLPFPDAYFDIITCFQVIEHVFDTKRLFTEIRRVLKLGGNAVFTTPNVKIRLPDGMKPWNKFHVREYAANELESLLRDHFSKVSLDGLFAPPVLYEIERARILRALMAANQEEKGNHCAPFFLHLVPSPLRNAIKYLVYLLKDRAKMKKFINTYSTADLFYSTENMDASLDLRAKCIS